MVKRSRPSGTSGFCEEATLLTQSCEPGAQVTGHLTGESTSQGPTASEFQAGLEPGLSLMPQVSAYCSASHLQRRPGCWVSTHAHTYVHS